MPRSTFKQTIYEQLVARQDLLNILGPVTADNPRIFAAWPQQTPKLSGIEPEEGWIAFYEEQTVVLFLTTLEEWYFDFHCWLTRLSMAEDIIDILDDLWHWKLAGQNSFIAGGYNVLHSQRIHVLETYDAEIKMYRKILRYRFRTQKTPFTSGATA